MVWSPLAGGLLTGKFSAEGKGPEDSRRSKFDFPVIDKQQTFRCVEAMRPMAAEQKSPSLVSPWPGSWPSSWSPR